MKRILITESQFNTIIKSEVTELKNSEVLEEGWKEIVLSLGLLAGVVVGKNQSIAQNIKQDTKNKIEYVLNNDELLNQAIDSLESMGYKDASEKVIDNAENVKQQLKNPLRKVVKKTVKDYETLAKKLKAGYAITGIQQDTLQNKIMRYDTLPPIINVYEVDVPLSDQFSTGLFGSSAEMSDSIQKVFDQIKANDGVIVGITIESSTDTEPIAMGNQKLAERRAESVLNVLKNLGVDTNIVNIDTKPEQGPNIFNKNMTSQERDDARQQTSPFRYVKLKLEVVKIIDGEPTIPIETTVDVIVNTFDLAKTKGKDMDINFELPSIKSNKSVKVKKIKPCNKVECTFK